jgi:hypothetical protein
MCAGYAARARAVSHSAQRDTPALVAVAACHDVRMRCAACHGALLRAAICFTRDAAALVVCALDLSLLFIRRVGPSARLDSLRTTLALAPTGRSFHARMDDRARVSDERCRFKHRCAGRAPSPPYCVAVRVAVGWPACGFVVPDDFPRCASAAAGEGRRRSGHGAPPPCGVLGCCLLHVVLSAQAGAVPRRSGTSTSRRPIGPSARSSLGTRRCAPESIDGRACVRGPGHICSRTLGPMRVDPGADVVRSGCSCEAARPPVCRSWCPRPAPTTSCS